MSYMDWSNEKIMQTGLRLKELLPQAWQNLKKMPLQTSFEIMQAQKAAIIINDAEATLIALRKEYKKRITK